MRPSATVAALASLATGVAPDIHRLVQPGLGFLPRVSRLRPVARELARRGVPADVVTAELPRRRCRWPGPSPRRPACARLLPAGRRARDTAAAADWLVSEPGTGLVFVYLPDCDEAGHAHGWMSARYLEAAAEVDAAIGLLSAQVEECAARRRRRPRRRRRHRDGASPPAPDERADPAGPGGPRRRPRAPAGRSGLAARRLGHGAVVVRRSGARLSTKAARCSRRSPRCSSPRRRRGDPSADPPRRRVGDDRRPRLVVAALGEHSPRRGDARGQRPVPHPRADPQAARRAARGRATRSAGRSPSCRCPIPSRSRRGTPPPRRRSPRRPRSRIPGSRRSPCRWPAS